MYDKNKPLKYKAKLNMRAYKRENNRLNRKIHLMRNHTCAYYTRKFIILLYILEASFKLRLVTWLYGK